MNWLAENSLPIWLIGAVALTMALIVFFQTRSTASLLGVVVVILIAASLLLVEKLLITPREAVENTLYALAARVEANDVSGATSYLAPTADARIRSDVETLMPQVLIDRARITSQPEITVDSDGQSAQVQMRGFIFATVKKEGHKGGVEDKLNMTWILNGDRWLLESYTSEKNWGRALR